MAALSALFSSLAVPSISFRRQLVQETVGISLTECETLTPPWVKGIGTKPIEFALGVIKGAQRAPGSPTERSVGQQLQTPEPGQAGHQGRTLTAVLLVTHVPAVVVVVTLPDAVDAVPIGAPVLVGQARVLWGTRDNREKLA